jgi:hypothetical protein
MVGKALVGHRNQPPVKAGFTHAGLVSGGKEYRLALRVKGKRYAPDTIRRIEPQFLHVRMPGAVQRIGMRAAQLRPVDL